MQGISSDVMQLTDTFDAIQFSPDTVYLIVSFNLSSVSLISLSLNPVNQSELSSASILVCLIGSILPEHSSINSIFRIF